jgi:excisionase family DNA binding protein
MEILTKKEVAELLKVSVSTVDTLRKQGLPSFSIGNAVRFNKEAVLTFVAQLSN